MLCSRRLLKSIIFLMYCAVQPPCQFHFVAISLMLVLHLGCGNELAQLPVPHQPYVSPLHLEYELGQAAERGDAGGIREVFAQYERQGLRPRISIALLNAIRLNRHDAVSALLADVGVNVDLGAEFVDRHVPPGVVAIYLEPGTTPLMIASARGNDFMVQALLDMGADANLKSQSGITALKLARERRHKEVIGMLEKAGAKD